MTSLADVVRKGRCVDADRVPCPKALAYLKKKGLVCKASGGPPKPKPVPARKKRTKSFFQEWFG